MPFNTNKYLENNYETSICMGDFGVIRTERLELNNGVLLSLQASEGHLCSPRSAFGPYTNIEVGFMSGMYSPFYTAFHKEFEQYYLGEYVYGQVPVTLLDKYINKIGVKQ